MAISHHHLGGGNDRPRKDASVQPSWGRCPWDHTTPMIMCTFKCYNILKQRWNPREGRVQVMTNPIVRYMDSCDKDKVAMSSSYSQNGNSDTSTTIHDIYNSKLFTKQVSLITKRYKSIRLAHVMIRDYWDRNKLLAIVYSYPLESFLYQVFITTIVYPLTPPLTPGIFGWTLLDHIWSFSCIIGQDTTKCTISSIYWLGHMIKWFYTETIYSILSTLYCDTILFYRRSFYYFISIDICTNKEHRNSRTDQYIYIYIYVCVMQQLNILHLWAIIFT